MANELQEQPYRLDEEQFSALHTMAYVFLEHQQYNKAIPLLRTLNKLEPENHLITLSLSYSLCCMERYQDAEQIISAHKDPGEMTLPVFHLVKAKIALAQQQQKEAEAQFQLYLN